MPRRRRHGGGRTPELAGTGLHRDPRTGIYVWRRVNPLTGRREKHSTGARTIDLALRARARLEEEHAQRKAGFDPRAVDWRKPLEPLVADYATAIARHGEGPRRESTRLSRVRELRRALELLRLQVLGDLRDVARLDATVRALESPALTRATLRRAFQDVLKGFAKWLAQNGRHLDADPLAAWAPIPYDRQADAEAFEPEHLARALVAAGWLDALHGRAAAQRPLFLALLVTGARTEALLEAQADALDAGGGRVALGLDVGNKRRGVAALDPATLAELVAHRGERHEGPLFPGPDGGPIADKNRRSRLLKTWKEAVALGHVWRLWPAGEPWTIEGGLLVARALLVGEARVSKGGNPKRVTQATLEARAAHAAAVGRLADALRGPWSDAMAGCSTLKALRATCRTWAVARRVPENLVDLQLGHESESIGRKHYTDASSPVLVAEVRRQVPAAVRAVLDEALAALGEERRDPVVPTVVPIQEV